VGDSNLVIMFEHGGPIFHFIMVLSVVALGLVIERFIWLSKTGKRDDIFFAGFQKRLEEGSPKAELIELCEQQDSPLGELLQHSVEHGSLGLLALRRISLDFFGEEVRPQLEQNLNWLATIGRLAPMIGLFGTVYGMMGAFNRMAHAATQAKPQELAGDINIALATTVGGLFVALLTVGFHTVLVQKVRNLERNYQRKLGKSLPAMRGIDSKESA